MTIETLASCQMIQQLNVAWNGDVNFDSLFLVVVVAVWLIRMKR